MCRLSRRTSTVGACGVIAVCATVIVAWISDGIPPRTLPTNETAHGEDPDWQNEAANVVTLLAAFTCFAVVGVFGWVWKHDRDHRIHGYTVDAGAFTSDDEDMGGGDETSLLVYERANECSDDDGSNDVSHERRIAKEASVFEECARSVPREVTHPNETQEQRDARMDEQYAAAVAFVATCATRDPHVEQ